MSAVRKEPRARCRSREWRRLNRLHWEDRVAIHLGPRGYDFDRLRAGQTRLNVSRPENCRCLPENGFCICNAISERTA